MKFKQRFYQHTHNSSNAKAPFCIFYCLVFITQYCSANAKNTKGPENPHLRDVMVIVDVVAQETFLLEVGEPWLHHLVEDVVAPLDLLQLDDLILQGHLGVLLLAVPRADHGEVGDDLLGVLRLSCTRLAAKKVPSETSGREVKKRNESLKDQTRPGVDKVKPKVWFKYSL